MKTLHSHKGYFIIFAIILLIGVWLRLEGILHNLFAFTYDSGRDLMIVEKAVSSLKPPLIGATTGQQGIFYGPWWYYSLIPAFVITGGSPQLMTGYISLLSILSMLGALYVGRKIGGMILGFAFASFFAVSESLIPNQMWNPYLSFPLTMGILYVLYLIFANKKKPRLSHYTILGVLLGLTIDSEIVFGLLILISTCILLLIYKHAKNDLINYLGIVLGILFTLLPRIIFDLRHDFIMGRKVLSLLSGSSETTFPNLFYTVPNRMTILKDFWMDSISARVEIIGYILLISLGTSLFFAFKKYKYIEKQFIYFILISTVVFWVALSLFNHDIESHYLIGLPILFVMLLSFGFLGIYRLINNKLLVISAVVLLCFLSLYQLGFFVINKPEWKGDASVFKNQLSVATYVFKKANGRRFDYLVYTPPIYPYHYDYLLEWMGKRQYNYVPGASGEKLLFVILEPDNLSFRQDAWLEIRKGDGKIIEMKSFAGNIVVQTRIR